MATEEPARAVAPDIALLCDFLDAVDADDDAAAALAFRAILALPKPPLVLPGELAPFAAPSLAAGGMRVELRTIR